MARTPLNEGTQDPKLALAQHGLDHSIDARLPAEKRMFASPVVCQTCIDLRRKIEEQHPTQAGAWIDTFDHHA